MHCTYLLLLWDNVAFIRRECFSKSSKRMYKKAVSKMLQKKNQPCLLSFVLVKLPVLIVMYTASHAVPHCYKILQVPVDLRHYKLYPTNCAFSVHICICMQQIKHLVHTAMTVSISKELFSLLLHSLTLCLTSCSNHCSNVLHSNSKRPLLNSFL